MRVAFTIIGGDQWTGGINYLENLLSAIAEFPECGIKPVLFIGSDVEREIIDRFNPYLTEEPVVSSVWNKSKFKKFLRLISAIIIGRDIFASREFSRHSIDVVFQHGAWYGSHFKFPTIAWIPDFQHKRLPNMFPRWRVLWRDIGYHALVKCSSRIMVSSLDAKKDCIDFYPVAKNKVTAVPFAVKMPKVIGVHNLMVIRDRYNLPDRYYYLPNQLWKHKNHINTILAVKLLSDKGVRVSVVYSGKISDNRDKKYPQSVLKLISDLKLSAQFIRIGFIPYADISPIMSMSLGVINPSFFEGWSTTVEEAKSVGVPLLLSNLAIHREQASGYVRFFDPYSVDSIANVLASHWFSYTSEWKDALSDPGIQAYRSNRSVFAKKFADICRLAIND